MTSEPIAQLTIKELFAGQAGYVIPVYQRNYAWGQKEISQLMQDIMDTYKEDETSAYYLGTLVVALRDAGVHSGHYEVIDGQQRLITLFLLLCALQQRHVKNGCLTFESRNHSNETLKAILAGSHWENTDNLDSALQGGYRAIREELQRIPNHDDIAAYLNDHVVIFRVGLPQDTDRNHYFEIMNTRGEQLEKHEILKARMMKKFDDDKESRVFGRIWDACSNMEKYVSVCFEAKLRDKIFDFSDNEGAVVNLCSFDTIGAVLLPNEDESNYKERGNTFDKTVLEYLQTIAPQTEGKPTSKEEDDATGERFSSIVDFPNFLLLVLRVHLKQKKAGEMPPEEMPPLDDKQLLKAFEPLTNKGSNKDDVKKFIIDLLICKHLFDHYVIKRDYHEKNGKWGLKRYKKYEKDNWNWVNTFGDEKEQEDLNRQICMIQAAFHVSAPTQNYKHWLSAVLQYLYTLAPQKDSKGAPRTVIKVSPDEYLNMLEALANAFLFDRYLNSDPISYEDIIFVHKGTCKKAATDIDSVSFESFLSYGTIRNNFVFNYLDYLLWQCEEIRKSDKKIQSFEFTFRSSVEHYFPQNPENNSNVSYPDNINFFGNLCLITHSKNSSFSNKSTAEKRASCKNLPTIDSVKQFLMMKGENWGTKEIKEHEEQMIAHFKAALKKCQ